MKKLNLIETDQIRQSDRPKNYAGSYLPVADFFGAKKLGFHVSVIEPKNFSWPYHAHEQDEELFYVVEGEAIVRHNNTYNKVKAGDLFFFPTGRDNAHNIYNHTDKAFRYFGLSNMSSEFDGVYYPDSKKEMREDGVFQGDQKVSYFHDEEDPAKYWSAEALRGEV